MNADPKNWAIPSFDTYNCRPYIPESHKKFRLRKEFCEADNERLSLEEAYDTARCLLARTREKNERKKEKRNKILKKLRVTEEEVDKAWKLTIQNKNRHHYPRPIEELLSCHYGEYIATAQDTILEKSLLRLEKLTQEMFSNLCSTQKKTRSIEDETKLAQKGIEFGKQWPNIEKAPYLSYLDQVDLSCLSPPECNLSKFLQYAKDSEEKLALVKTIFMCTYSTPRSHWDWFLKNALYEIEVKHEAPYWKELRAWINDNFDLPLDLHGFREIEEHETWLDGTRKKRRKNLTDQKEQKLKKEKRDAERRAAHEKREIENSVKKAQRVELLDTLSTESTPNKAAAIIRSSYPADYFPWSLVWDVIAEIHTLDRKTQDAFLEKLSMSKVARKYILPKITTEKSGLNS